MSRKKLDIPYCTNRLLGLMAVLLTAFNANSQAMQRPAMVIGIVVEGLSDDYLELLKPQFVDGGFNRLMKNGVRMTDISFGPGLDPTAATAVIYTGASPMVNGIPAAAVYSPSTNVSSPILLDAKSMGNFTDETYSPKNLKVSTLSDEVRMDSDGDGFVYSIAADPQISIILSGHAANGAYWIYDRTGNWASSIYYRDMPKIISNRNYRTPLRSRLDTMKWEPSIDISLFPLLSKSEKTKSFSHTFPSKQYDRYARFKSTPMANKEVTDIGIDLINAMSLGYDNAMDMLNLAYTVTPHEGSRAETIDLYLRLDKDLARLFETAEKVSGAGNTTIFLSGLPSTGQYPTDDVKWRVPTGEYSIKKALSLLDMYLMATHGNADWVTGYNNKQFYLNRKLITDKGLNLANFRTEVADFLARMAGVCNVFTIDDVIAARVGADPQALKRNISVEHSGDVFVEINPGWQIVDDPSLSASKKRHGAERMNSNRIPAFILTPSISSHRIDYPVDARAIAPAIARTIRIRAPNAASESSLRTN